MCEVISNREWTQMMLEHDGLYSQGNMLAEMLELLADQPRPKIRPAQLACDCLSEQHFEVDKSPSMESSPAIQDAQVGGFL